MGDVAGVAAGVTAGVAGWADEPCGGGGGAGCPGVPGALEGGTLTGAVGGSVTAPPVRCGGVGAGYGGTLAGTDGLSVGGTTAGNSPVSSAAGTAGCGTCGVSRVGSGVSGPDGGISIGQLQEAARLTVCIAAL